MKFNRIFIPLLIVVITIASCSTMKNTSNHKKHWGYDGETGPDQWTKIEKNSDCGGKFQSPINIVTVNANVNESLKPINLFYKNNTQIHEVTNNGHSIQYNFSEGDYIMFKNKKFNLKQIHFHESSEHTINGVRYPLVIHMVHVSKDNKYLVLAVMAKEGVSSAPFSFLENYLPLKVGQTKTIDKPFDLKLNLPKNKGYYYYKGSLTTPPCTEGVNWFVLKQPITVSLEQVNILKKLMPLNNYRNEQPLNGRKVQMTK